MANGPICVQPGLPGADFSLCNYLGTYCFPQEIQRNSTGPGNFPGVSRPFRHYAAPNYWVAKNRFDINVMQHFTALRRAII